MLLYTVTILLCLSQIDFENFDLPEEDRVSDINLCGAPLKIFTSTAEKPLNMCLSPVKTEEMSWESSKWKTSTSFSAYSAH